MTFLTEEDREETIIERRERERPSESGRAENEEVIPLIPNIKGDQRKVITHLEVWKVNPPGDGFKGRIATSATPETIAKLYGDGTYDINAIAGDGKTLRRAQGLKVAWVNPDKKDELAVSPANVVDKEANLLTWQAEQHERSSARTESFGRMVVDTVTTQSKQALDNQLRAFEQQVARDREFFSTQAAAQREWSQQIMQQQALAHQQAMERSEQNFRQAMEVTRASHERQLQTQNPNANLRIFQEAFQFMGSMGLLESGDDEDEEAPWVTAIEAGAEAISNITDAYRTKVQAAVNTPKLNEPKPQSNLNTKPSAPDTQQAPAPKKKKKRGLFSREDVAALAQMKAELEKRGIPFSRAIQYASQNLMGAGNGENGVSKPGDSGGDSEESHEDPGNPDMGDG